jgi:hypothetical protein
VQSKVLRDVKIWKVNNYSLNIEHYDSEIIVKDENGNNVKISKKNKLYMLLDVNGNFKSD